MNSMRKSNASCNFLHVCVTMVLWKGHDEQDFLDDVTRSAWIQMTEMVVEYLLGGIEVMPG